jgi:pyochelin biosynthetic protein PchG
VTANVVVCGTGFGRVYLRALEAGGPDAPRGAGDLRLTGVLARGSERSRACAERAGVPLYTDPGQLPADTDIAVVAVYAGVNGGPGSELARQLMERGVHVLQEGPLHHDELAESLRVARRAGVVFRVSTHYVRVEPVRRFIAAARRLTARRPVLYADAACGLQVFYHLFDILRLALGGLRPWSFEDARPTPVFHTLTGAVRDVPLTLRVQNQLNPSDPDNHAHLLHRITLGTDGGSLTLFDTHGPLLWSPRPHFPSEERSLTRLEEAAAGHLDHAATTPLGDAAAPSYREVVGRLWPDAALRALTELHEAVREGHHPLAEGHAQLAVSHAWRDAAVRLGPPELTDATAVRPIGAGELAGELEVPRCT